MKHLRVSLMALLLAGCITTGANIQGNTERLGANTYRVAATGASGTSETQMTNWLMLQAAQTTLARGATHFIVGPTIDTTKTSAHYVPAQPVSSYGPGGQMRTSWVGGGMQTITTPGREMHFSTLTIGKGKKAPPDAIEAAGIIKDQNPK